MKKKCIAMAACLLLVGAGGTKTTACTDLVVGKKASVDGSVIISYAADSHTLYGVMYRSDASPKWSAPTP